MGERSGWMGQGFDVFSWRWVFLGGFCELFNRVALEIVVYTGGIGALAFNWCSPRFIFASLRKGFGSVDYRFRFGVGLTYFHFGNIGLNKS
jgi:hypothetical protein